MITRVFLAILLLLANPALALDELDSGKFAVVYVEGQPTNQVFRFSPAGRHWIAEEPLAGGLWKPMECEGNCDLYPSTPAQLELLFSKADFPVVSPSCVDNYAFAFCSYLAAPGQTQRRYAMIALVTPGPRIIRLVRVP